MHRRIWGDEVVPAPAHTAPEQTNPCVEIFLGAPVKAASPNSVLQACLLRTESIDQDGATYARVPQGELSEDVLRLYRTVRRVTPHLRPVAPARPLRHPNPRTQPAEPSPMFQAQSTENVDLAAQLRVMSGWGMEALSGEPGKGPSSRVPRTLFSDVTSIALSRQAQFAYKVYSCIKQLSNSTPPPPLSPNHIRMLRRWAPYMHPEHRVSLLRSLSRRTPSMVVQVHDSLDAYLTSMLMFKAAHTADSTTFGVDWGHQTSLNDKAEAVLHSMRLLELLGHVKPKPSAISKSTSIVNTPDGGYFILPEPQFIGVPFQLHRDMEPPPLPGPKREVKTRIDPIGMLRSWNRRIS